MKTATKTIPAPLGDETLDERVADLMSYGITRRHAEERAKRELEANRCSYCQRQAIGPDDNGISSCKLCLID